MKSPPVIAHGPPLRLKYAASELATLHPVKRFGRITSVAGMVVECEGLPNVAVGGMVQLTDAAARPRTAEVVGVRVSPDNRPICQVMPFGALDGIAPGGYITRLHHTASIRANHSFIGRVINALGEPTDGKGPLGYGGVLQAIKQAPPPASQRRPIGPKLDTGVKAINTFVPLCQGQRLGVFAGSGVGKSVLMSMFAKFSAADVNVIGLIGERGREVREFVEDQLGPEGMARSVIIVATSDEPPLMRRQAAFLTLALAEYFRDCGQQVMVMLDSITRFALAQREIGLASGEPPTTRGFTPSVFAELPKLLERAGPGTGQGAISAIFSVLVEGGDLDEPIADAVRGIVDGHIVLTRKLAERNHFPAIDILQSISRMVPQCLTAEEHQAVSTARGWLATYRDMEELIRLGAYQKGSDPQVDMAIEKHEPLSKFLQQSPQERLDLASCFQRLQQIIR